MDRLDLGVARVHAHALVEQRNLLVDRVQVGGRLLAGIIQAMQHQRIARTRTAQLHLQPADRMPVILAHQLPRHQQSEDVGEDRLDPRRGEILVDAEQRVGEIDDVAVPREVHARIDDVELASQFREHPVGADQRIGQRAVHVPFAFRRHDRHVRHRVGIQRVRFEGLHLGVDPSDQIVGGVGQPASRMELVPDGAAGAHRQHLEALVFHRVLVLQRMEITPIRMIVSY